MAAKKIICIIPAFNEKKTIAQVVREAGLYVDEVVVVNDGSIDNTAILAREAGATVLDHLINRDQGAALETGNQYALAQKADIIVHFDADGQFLAEEIGDLIKPLLNGDYDVVFGSRFLEKKSKIPWLKDKLIFPLARIINKILFGVNLTDPQSGFRAMSAAAAAAIHIEQDGKAHCSEILAKVFNKKFRIKEVPITVIYNDFGLNLFGGIKIIKDTLLSKLSEK